MCIQVPESPGIPNLSLGIDLGGTDIKAAVVSPSGALVWSQEIATRASEGRDAVLDRIVALIDEAGQAAAWRIGAVGIAIPGILDMESGTIELLTNLTQDWNGFGLRDALEQRTNLPVALLNDVRAATLAELRWGAGTPYRDFVCVAIGTGIGGGLVLDRKVFWGSRGAAGEVGHQTVLPDGPRCNCGNHGCLEALSSATAIARAAKLAIEAGDAELAEFTGSRQPSAGQVATAARAGCAGAWAIYERAGTYVGQAMANLVVVLNPEAVIVGGGVSKAGELLLGPIREEIARRTVVFSAERGGVQVIASPLGVWAGAIGAAAWADECATGAIRV